VTRAAAILFVLAIASFVASPRAAAARPITGKKFVRLLEQGRAMSGVTVSSEVNISGKAMSHPFACRGCTFKKGLIATGTTFEGFVDLRGSRVYGRAFFTEATFKHTALLGSPIGKQDVRFLGGADFSVATF